MASMKKVLAAGFFGILYGLAGAAELFFALVPGMAGPAGPFLVPASLTGGLVLCIVAAVYLAAVHRFVAGTGNGSAYLHVAMALSVIFGTAAFLSAVAQGLDLLLFGPEPWNPAALMVPMVYLAIVPAALLLRKGCNGTGMEVTG